MLRQLLTLLALLTGLAAAGEPVNARISGIEQVRLESGAQTAAASTVPAGIVRGQLARAEIPAAAHPHWRNIRPAAVVPTVRLGPDRARE